MREVRVSWQTGQCWNVKKARTGEGASFQKPCKNTRSQDQGRTGVYGVIGGGVSTGVDTQNNRGKNKTTQGGATGWVNGCASGSCRLVEEGAVWPGAGNWRRHLFKWNFGERGQAQGQCEQAARGAERRTGTRTKGREWRLRMAELQSATRNLST